MLQVAEMTKPDLIIFVMDGSIGQAAHDQAKAFKDTVEVCTALHPSCSLFVNGGSCPRLRGTRFRLEAGKYTRYR